MKNINEVVRYMKKRSMMNYDINMTISHELWDHIINILDSYCLKDGVPEKSGKYLCWCKNEYFTVLHYSDKHKKFNCHDEDKETPFVIEVVAWCELPEVVKDERVVEG